MITVASYNLDLNGLVCPLPIAKRKRKLGELEIGDVLDVRGDFIESGENVKRYVKAKGHEILDYKTEGENFFIKIKKS